MRNPKLHEAANITARMMPGEVQLIFAADIWMMLRFFGIGTTASVDRILPTKVR